MDFLGFKAILGHEGGTQIFVFERDLRDMMPFKPGTGVSQGVDDHC